MRSSGPYLLTVLMCLTPLAASAQTASEIQTQIDDQNSQLAAVNKEIAQYQAQLDATSAKKTTLQTKLNGIIVSLKKTAASITATKTKLTTTQLQLKQLEGTIADTQHTIADNKAGLGESIRLMHMEDRRSLPAQVLGSEDISSAWKMIDRTAVIQDAVRAQIEELAAEEAKLSQAKDETDKKKKTLEDQQKTLVAQQGSITATKKAQDELLAQTKAQESAYQALLKKKKEQQASMEAALSDLNAKFRVAVDLSKVTPAGAGTLQWPLDNVRITQYFGNTPFAASGAYNGKGHNGIDLAAPIGTPLHTALTGTVIGTGNTDAIKGCYSFGRWVLIKHANGLDTMYAHLSQINVSQGQEVKTGDLIGYTGETGYATGPHLHFGVYVSSATQIIKLGQATNQSTPCANAVMPVAPLSGYLNPMNYLPAN
ncbi:peptidoglycan DD-metalloendopeptidase family protein [Candidatus Kaiserbacteria bacterium]|nr:peptidoglycan DD-metalloendopeptidase family protein [Candidatus Kaiserbacteria bacterium]